MSSPKLDPGRAALVVVDVQEGFREAVAGFDGVVSATATMVRGSTVLGVPVIVTEQYPKGLGATVPEVAEHLPSDAEPISKTVFSAASADGFDLGGRDQAVVCGIEAHVCVNQTVLELLEAGTEVHVVTDGVGSRSEANRDLGLGKAERAGAWLTSVETALFELLGEAGGDDFKAVQRLVLEHAP
ncbi:MAG TPA: isochorismatase family protein [Solirubrobacterales bacterium]|nr:isochorismatase family protein [Solirubrobacterales bacterium]